MPASWTVRDDDYNLLQEKVISETQNEFYTCLERPLHELSFDACWTVTVLAVPEIYTHLHIV